MNSTRLRRVTLSTAVAAALTGLVACTSTDGAAGRPEHVHSASPEVVAALRRADRATDAADSARVRSTTTVGSQMSLRADGALGWSDDVTGTLTLTYTGGTALETMRRLGSTTPQTRYLPDAYYARMGDTFAAQSGGRHWIRYGYADLGGLDQVRDGAPHQSVKLLLAAGDLRRVGAERVEGVDTTHYTGTVTTAALTGPGSRLDARELAAVRERLTRAGVATERVDLWVDGRDLLVKKAEKGETASGGYSQTAHYRDYGVDVSVTRPPAADTADYKELTATDGER
ncbi:MULTISPECIES: hypothetical protein [Streptomyces]|uniref:Lipoprotein n=1 Tax=Streptomyces doudnae TaxID=3075536 RepID=A0ABD5EIE3_9ACTN|nr:MULTISPECIES: hypothetical protein [unclassified Streptomyces]MDT0434112.1 hypothetical protein [Streptomyces sp. DSM 41981]MYQ62819.1 hypothetical protein [Streptomyces sp. SID4950]SCD45106.1 hypothetical protein GA0115242_105617 [Streptomyces sp. SolWspMP-5a-2]